MSSLQSIADEILNHDNKGLAWDDPLPIPNGLLPVEKFDYSLLPESMRQWVFDEADRMQCPPDFVAVSVMVSLSAVIGRKASIQPKRYDSWEVIPNLWGGVIGRAGVMKSPAISAGSEPLERLEARASDEYRKQVALYQSQKEIDAIQQKQNKSKAEEAVKNGDTEAARRMLQPLQSMDEPVRKRYKVNDASFEALGEILIDNPWGLLVYRDELVGLLKGLDREGNEGARAFYLQGYDGNQSYTFDRIMRGKGMRIPAVCISLMGGIQPARIASYISDAVRGGSGDDGLLQRFGLMVYPDIETEWVNVDRARDHQARGDGFRVFERLDAMKADYCPHDDREIPKVYRFSDEAQDLFDEWRSEFENNLRGGDLHPAVESHLSKYRKLVPAIALICSLADAEPRVSADSLNRALAWSLYLRSHAERIYSLGLNHKTAAANALLKKIKAGVVKDGFKPSNVYVKGWAGLTDTHDVIDAIAMLCDLGYLREEEIRHSGGGRPSKTYLINPKVKRDE